MDGKQLDHLDAVAVRRQMGVVLQGSQPLPGSLYENIVGAVGGTLDDAWEARNGSVWPMTSARCRWACTRSSSKAAIHCRAGSCSDS
ncbi:hypothetical protein [Thiocystis violacea]|uniref:hypothetical protein n=1 Tax=Thiocystis violacea TaxID=13725 RepID=UPI003B82CDA4